MEEDPTDNGPRQGNAGETPKDTKEESMNSVEAAQEESSNTESEVPLNSVTAGGTMEAESRPVEEAEVVSEVHTSAWQGEVLLEFTGAKLIKPENDKPFITYTIFISYHLPAPNGANVSQTKSNVAAEDTNTKERDIARAIDETRDSVGKQIGHRTIEKRWEDFEALERELLSNENTRLPSERCNFRRIEHAMGLWGRDDPEGRFVNQRRQNLQSFSNDIMNFYDNLSEQNKYLLDQFFMVTEIMLEHHQRKTEEEEEEEAKNVNLSSKADERTDFNMAGFNSSFLFCMCNPKEDEGA